MERTEEYVRPSWRVLNAAVFVLAFAATYLGLILTRLSTWRELLQVTHTDPIRGWIGIVLILFVLLAGAYQLNKIAKWYAAVRRAEIGNVLMPPSPETETDDTVTGARRVAQTVFAAFQALVLVVAIGLIGAFVGTFLSGFPVPAEGFEWLAPAMNWLAPAMIPLWTSFGVFVGIGATWTFWSRFHLFKRSS